MELKPGDIVYNTYSEDYCKIQKVDDDWVFYSYQPDDNKPPYWQCHKGIALIKFRKTLQYAIMEATDEI